MPYMTGKAIGSGMSKGLGRGLEQLMMSGLGIEILYSFVIITCSLMIYLGTKELYDITRHRGIRYFRLTFLFFALAYFFRSFIKILIIYFGKQELAIIAPLIFWKLPFVLFMYFSVMAIFYLLYSVLWKRLKHNGIYIFHIAAASIAILVTFLKNNLNLVLVVNLLLFVFIVCVVYISYRQSEKKKSLNLYAVYLLLCAFWILNIVDILIPNFFSSFQLLIYLASVGVFLGIVYKVLIRVGTN